MTKHTIDKVDTWIIRLSLAGVILWLAWRIAA